MAAIRARIVLIILIVGVLPIGCATVPLDQPKSHSEAITDTGETHFGSLANGWGIFTIKSLGSSR